MRKDFQPTMKTLLSSIATTRSPGVVTPLSGVQQHRVMCTMCRRKKENQTYLSWGISHHIYSSTNKSGKWGQPPLFCFGLLWNLSWLQVARTLFLHLIQTTGPVKGVPSPDRLPGHCLSTGWDRRVSPTEWQIPLARAVFLLCVTSNQHSTILTAARKADNIFFQGTKI